MKCFVLVILLVTLLSGCTSPFGYYEPATVQDGIISNPKVGWNGYSIKIPEGMTVFNPSTADPDTAQLTGFKKWFMKEDLRYATAGYISYTEHFLIEQHEVDFFISVVADTYSLSAGWGSITSMESTYVLRQIADRKMVKINDDSAKRTELEINGQKAWHISGTNRPYFKKDYVPLAYEGYFIIGKLKEAFWIEGIGAMDQRDKMKERVREMAESLQIH
ncbi:MAG: hypothetical protein V3V05_06895 [Pontiella sp.]